MKEAAVSTVPETELAIGRRTVSNHVSVILDKLGVTSRTAAAVVAVRDGLI